MAKAIKPIIKKPTVKKKSTVNPRHRGPGTITAEAIAGCSHCKGGKTVKL